MPKKTSGFDPDEDFQPTDEEQTSSNKNAQAPDAQEELARQVEEAQQKTQQYWERILRMQAENDNILRRAERDIANAHKFSLEKFVGELLPIVDSLELCVNNVPEDSQPTTQAVVEGVRLTLKMFYAALEKFGVKQINPISQPFNPEYEHAVSMQYDPKLPPNTVIAVLQKGYTLNDRLLRPALVVVSKAEE